jgi:hypothetical protein
VEQDQKFFARLVTQDPEVVASLEGAMACSWAGTPSQFDAQVRTWVETVKQPRFGVGYTKLVYQGGQRLGPPVSAKGVPSLSSARAAVGRTFPSLPGRA